ncbi:MAG: DUF3861 domain-containing protein [Acidobacteriota bacterium]|nr:DUF3861 domain-containing protein [Acidobacteriota bacterium]
MYRYRITVEALREDGQAQKLQFEATNHDDLFAVVPRIEGRFDYMTADEAKAFAVGLKLFGETVLHHREQPIFQSIKNALGDFMRELKSQVKK